MCPAPSRHQGAQAMGASLRGVSGALCQSEVADADSSLMGSPPDRCCRHLVRRHPGEVTLALASSTSAVIAQQNGDTHGRRTSEWGHLPIYGFGYPFSRLRVARRSPRR